MVSNIDHLTGMFDEFYIVKESSHQLVKENENTPKVNLDGTEQADLLFVFSTHLQGVDLEMIHKLIHNAMKLNREKVAFAYVSENQGLSFDDMIKITSIKKVLLWGQISDSGDGLRSYQPQEINGKRILVVDPPSAYHNHIELKTKLWSAIQQLVK